jgi:hypothetical protein
MRLSAQALNRATLARQLLLQREKIAAADAVRRVVALQGQEPASAYLALWNRVDALDPGEVDDAFAGYGIARATLLRMTLHVVHAEDYATFRDAIEPTMYATHIDGRFTPAGLTVESARALLRDLLAFTRRPRSADDLTTWLEPRLGDLPTRAVWRVLRQYAPLLRVPTGGPWSFTSRPSFVASRPRPSLDQQASAAALQRLAHRYLTAFGPASVADIAQFALVQQARVKPALRALGDAVEQLAGPDGATLFDAAGAPRPAEDTPAPPRLMPMWDSTLLAYADRSRIIPGDYRKLVIRSNGDVLSTLLVDGYVAGVWRVVDGAIEATAFHPLTEDTWDGLAVEADALLGLLTEREPQVYGRYDRWWARLPCAEARRLPGG